MLRPVVNNEEPNNNLWSEKVQIQTAGQESVWITALTMAEYVSMQDNDGKLTTFVGSLRAEQGWHQLIFHPTTQDALNDMAFHLSRGHVTMEPDNGIVLVALTMDTFNAASHVSQRSINFYQRGYHLQYMQVLSDCTYTMSRHEKDNVLICQVKQWNPTDLFSRWTWTKGYVWILSSVFNVEEILKTIPTSPVHTGFQQAMLQLGVQGTNELPQNLQGALAAYKAQHNFSEGRSTSHGRATMGHPDHKAWIDEQFMKAQLDKMAIEEDDNEDKRSMKRAREDKEAADKASSS
eukprot:Skav203158  [mRNA]  locus=scaffold371:59488:60363:+ [translate_table: standard]